MKFRKTIILLILAIFLFSITCVCASEIDIPIASEDTNQMGLSDSDKVIENNPQTSEEKLELSGDDESLSAQTDTEVLGDSQATYSDLAVEINTPGNVILTSKNYTYDEGSTAIIVNEDDKVIDGNGAVINMVGSNFRAFTVFAFGVTIKNLTIKNVNYESDGGAIYFENPGTVENCNFVNNSAYGSTSSAGAIYFNSNGNATNCNFTHNSAIESSGAVFFRGDGKVTNCNFAYNQVTGDYSRGGAVHFFNNAEVINCNFLYNTANGRYSSGGAFLSSESGTVTNCNFTENKCYYSDAGAIRIYKGASVTNCNFVKNYARNAAGTLFLNYGSVENCNFTSSTSNMGPGGAIMLSSGSVENCNFANCYASSSGAAIQIDSGSVTNCNFTNCKADNFEEDAKGGGIYMNSGVIDNCNFANNIAWNGGAVFIGSDGNVTNCIFSDNSASDNGGAVFIDSNGKMANCIFSDNSASYNGGAVYFFNNGEVTNCNFTGNNAVVGSAIYFQSASTTKTVSNSLFLNNRAKMEALEVTKNDSNIIITFKGKNNLLNAIYSNDEVIFTNVTYWGANGINNTGNSPITPSISNNEAGQNITVSVVVNDVLVVSDVKVTDENGMIVLDISVGENYFIGARHDKDSYYTEVEKTISNNPKFNVNVSSQTTNKKTVNITAKSNIPNEIIKGKLLFILPNSTEIDATYGGNGTWWALHTFDDYSEYNVNASYVGLENVIINNGTIDITKADSTITLDNVVLNYGESKNVDVVTTGSIGVTAKIDNVDVTVINNFTVQISDLNAGNHTLTITTIADDDHNSITKEVNITVNKIDSTLIVDNAELDYGSSINVTVSAEEAIGITAKIDGVNVTVDGYSIPISGLNAGNHTLTVTTIVDANHNSVTKTANITVNKIDSTLIVNNAELDYGSSINVTVSAEGAIGITAKIDGVNVTVDGYSIPISGLNAGNHTLTVTTIADANHNSVTKTANIAVNKLSTEIIIANETLDLKVNDTGTISATLTPADAGNLTFTSSNESVMKVSDDGSFVALSKGVATVTVSFAGNDNYVLAENKTITVTVTLKDASVSVENSTIDLYIDDSFDLNATPVPDILNVQYVSSNESVASVDDNGIVTAIGEGIAIITLTVGDGELFAINSTEVTVNVKKIDTIIDVDQNSLDLKAGDNSSISATLTPSDAGNLTFTSNDSSVVTVDDKGNVKAIAAGKAKIIVSFTGDYKYVAAENKTIEVTVTANDAKVNVTKTSYELFIGENDTIIAVTVPDGLKVEFATDDNNIISVDENGRITALGVGKAIIFVSVGDNSVYKYDVVYVNVTVSKNPTKIESSAVSVVYNAKKYLTVTLKDANGKAISGVEVTVDLNGVKTYTTDKNGQIKVSTKGLTPKVYAAKVTFKGDAKYLSSAKSIKVTVKKAKAKITAKKKTFKKAKKVKKYKITLKSGKTPIKKVKVTIKVGKKTYKAKTKSKGKATFKITKLKKKGTFKAVIKFAGNKYYKKVTKKVKVKVR